MKQDKAFDPVEHGLVGRSFVCAACGRAVEIPFSADQDRYGWWAGNYRCCTYKCMRQREVINQEDRKATVKRMYSSQHPIRFKGRVERFMKLYDYLLFISQGAVQSEAAARAGFSGKGRANDLRKRWADDDQFLQFLRDNGKTLPPPPPPRVPPKAHLTPKEYYRQYRSDPANRARLAEQDRARRAAKRAASQHQGGETV